MLNKCTDLCINIFIIGSGYVRKLIRLFVDGSTSDRFSSDKLNPEVSFKQQLASDHSFWQQSLLLLFCSGGLLVSYLIWGILQERVMVYRYREADDEPGELFTNSQFIVFMNRILALVIACIAMLFVKQKPHEAPLYKYSYSSLSNILSSWCQYEALKFVSFPVQVIAVLTCLCEYSIGISVLSHTQNFFERLVKDTVQMSRSETTGPGLQSGHLDLNLKYHINMSLLDKVNQVIQVCINNKHVISM